ncbi:MAG TPA: T9SS type A sorting domain-containing protein [Bacteroidia bacterium]|nr:T9SS type A sorting domain-containing protein [Bacteroidia bacterium]
MMAKKFSAIVIILLAAHLFMHKNTFAIALSTSAPDTARYFTFGGTKTEEFRDLTLTSDSGFALVGSTNGYGQGNRSVYLVRTDKHGNHIWSSVLGGSNVDRGYSILALNDGGFMIAGSSNSLGVNGYDGYLCRTDSNGEPIWEKGLGGADWDFFYNMEFLPDSTIIVCGESYTYSAGGSDAWVLRVDLQGNIVWQQNFGATGNDAFYGLSILHDAIYLCGAYQSSDLDGYLVKLDFSGQLIFEKTFNYLGADRFNAVDHTNFDWLFLSGGSIYTDSIGSEILIQQVDTNGVAGWALTGNGSTDDYFNAIVVKSNSELITAGIKNPGGFGQKGMWLVQHDSTLNNFRHYVFGGTLDEEGFSIIETPTGGLAVAGYTSSFGQGDLDACLLLLEKSEIDPLYIDLPKTFYETLSPIGIEEPFINRDILFLYPNPVNDYLFFESESKWQFVGYKILSIEGRICSQGEINKKHKGSIDISKMEPGIYFLLMNDMTGTEISAKIIKK